MGDDRLQSIRGRLLEEGYSSKVCELLVKKFKVPSATKGTLRAYQDVWTEFSSYCRRNGRRREDLEETDVANFIAERYSSGGASGSKISATITALDMTKKFLMGAHRPLAEAPVIRDLRKMAKRRRPPPKDKKPRSYFDPALIYRFIASNPTDRCLRSSDLRQKVEMLMVLDAAARGSDLFRTSATHMEWKTDSVVVYANWTKEEKNPGWTPLTFTCTCEALKNACTVCSMREYKSRPKIAERRRKAQQITFESENGPVRGKPFLLSHRGKAARISIETIRKDLQHLMTAAKLDSRWTPHDLRGAVASKLYNLQAGEERVLSFGRWKSKHTFLKHYFKQAFYKEAGDHNARKPLRLLSRMLVHKIDEQTFQQINERIEGEENYLDL